jgi:hypothetical protein
MTSAIAAPASPAPRDNRPVVGESVRFDGSTAQITRISPDGLADLIAYGTDGRPRFHSGIESGWQLGQWLTDADWEAGRPRSDLELVAEALARGDRAPEVGAWVTVAMNLAPMGPHSLIRSGIHIFPCRGKIREVFSMTLIDVDVFPVEPPEDPVQPDWPIQVNLRSVHASKANATQTALGFRESWAYPEEGLIVEFGGPTVQIHDIIPPYTCGACKKRVKRITPIFIGHLPLKNDPFGTQTPDKNICDNCLADAKDLLGIEPPPDPVPIVGPDPFADDEDESPGRFENFQLNNA